MKSHLLVCGGTFDLFHAGHEKFLRDGLNNSEKVILGITSDKYIASYKIKNIESFKTRKEAVLKYLSLINATEKFEIISIDNPFEPLLENKYIPDVLMVTPQTKKTAFEINEKRKKMNLSQLKILEVEMKKAEDGEYISSTRIRNGQINRNGRLYLNKKWENKLLILPENLRYEFQKPFGKILKTIPKNIEKEKTITIGDITTQEFNKKDLNQFLSVIDFKVKRNIKYSKITELGFSSDINTVKFINNPGTINGRLFEVIREAINSNNRNLILVNGEEDLVFFPAILTAPIGFKIYYGQPNVGLVEVEVSQESKEKAFELVSKFNVKSFDN